MQRDGSDLLGRGGGREGRGLTSEDYGLRHERGAHRLEMRGRAWPARGNYSTMLRPKLKAGPIEKRVEKMMSKPPPKPMNKTLSVFFPVGASSAMTPVAIGSGVGVGVAVSCMIPMNTGRRNSVNFL